MIASSHLGVMALTAMTGSISLAHIGVFIRKKMSSLAMSQSPLLSPACFTSKSQPAFIGGANFSGNNFFVSQPLSYSFKDRICFLFGNFRKFNGSIACPVYFHKNCISLVSLLCFIVSPSAIRWLVAPVGVYPVYRVPFWPSAHIVTKSLKCSGFSFPERPPSIANANSTTAVIMVLRIIGIIASVVHRRPYGVKRRRDETRHGTSPLFNAKATYRSVPPNGRGY